MKTWKFKKRFDCDVSLHPSWLHYYRRIRRIKQITFASAIKPDGRYLLGFNSSPLAIHSALALIISVQDR